jgi:two-component system, response regulator YesN
MKIQNPLRRGRVYYRYLLSYSLILLIPLILTVLLFNRAQNIVDEATDRANEQILDQMTSYIDRLMTDVLTISHLISHNERFTGFIYLKPPVGIDEGYRAFSIALDYNDYYGASSSIIKFYVYIDALDMIISHSGFFDSREYYLAHMSEVVENDTYHGYDDWMRIFQGPQSRHFVAMNTETPTDNVVRTIAMVSPLPVGQRLGSPKGWMVLEIDLDEIRKVIENTRRSNRSILLIDDSETGILFSSNSNFPVSRLEKEEDRIGEVANGDILTLDGVRYVLNYRHSTKIHQWSYVSLVPYDIYAGQFMALRRFTLIAFGICFFVGVSLIYWSATARYKPIRSLLRLMSPDSRGTVSLHSDEFNLITKSINAILTEDRRLKQEIDSAHPILGQRYLRQLLTGESPLDSSTIAQLREYTVILPNPFFVLVLVDCEDSISGVYRLENRFARSSFDTQISDQLTLPDVYPHYFVRDLNYTVGVFINTDTRNLEPILALFLEKKNDIERIRPVVLSIGISEAHPIEDGFDILYQEAERALGYRLVKGCSRPIIYSDIKKSTRAYYYPIEQEKKLINSIRAGNFPVADAIIEDVYIHNFGDSLISLEMARCLMFDLISTMIKTIDSTVIEEGEVEFWHEVKPVTRMMSSTSFERLRVEMQNILHRVCEFVQNSRIGHNERLRDQILSYIHENYQDQNLCPGSIADNFKRNPAYLSRFFREQNQIGISTYIKQYRISKAKPLLLRDEITINELAWNVGFSSSNAFIRAFKEYEGMTPGQYKTVNTIPK